ncbi:16S rRNA (guanine(966)-N(2))-methyltransferase RsmD [candidate division KSB1 bacterium 4484_87]|nr:MAG: 16S rRNA (guanine(966)-N(2))-methyltransferase RsmD [candidate division KSB1 bacterium 4484_87]
MRVIAGQCKGRILFRPKSKAIRPTSDRVKESLFSFLGDRIVGQSVLDLFAGTGNLAIEALSRGAEHAVLVDRAKEAVEIIYKNVNLTGFSDKCRVVRSDVFQYLRYAIKHDEKFGVIFADPPYLQNVIGSLLQLIDLNDLLNTGGLFVLEHDSEKSVNIALDSLSVMREKNYGTTTITIFQNMR